jgi:hypothetical protein
MALKLKYSPSTGRRWNASAAIAEGATIISAAPYAAAVFDNAKKRVCAVCLKFERGNEPGSKQGDLGRGATLPFHW